jgi:hypothetical protein
VETPLLPLTNAAQSRTVNGGTFFRTRVITGVSALLTQSEELRKSAPRRSGDLK